MRTSSEWTELTVSDLQSGLQMQQMFELSAASITGMVSFILWTEIGTTGIFTLFVADIGEGEVYKYEIVTQKEA